MNIKASFAILAFSLVTRCSMSKVCAKRLMEQQVDLLCHDAATAAAAEQGRFVDLQVSFLSLGSGQGCAAHRAAALALIKSICMAPGNEWCGGSALCVTTCVC